MRACVTGAGGFVGSALCRALAERGHEVVGLTRDPEQTRKRVGEGVRLVEGSIGFPRDVANAAQGCVVLFHAAGLPPVAAPGPCFAWIHVAGSENVLRAARHAGVKRLVHVSCADVSLVDEDRMHWNEQRALTGLPVGLFARSKLMAEELVLAQSDQGLSTTALRPALLWGQGDVDGLARLARGLRGRTFQLYEGGRNVIATTHIDNLIRAALLAADARAAAGRAYYITDGEFLEAREWYRKLLGALGLPPPPMAGKLIWGLISARYRETLRRDGGCARAELLRRARSALFDVSRAVRDLSYEPKIDLAAELDALAAWVTEQGGIDALIARARPAPCEADIAAQVTAAGGP